MDQLDKLIGAVAHLGERIPCTDEVAGSIPVGSTTNKYFDVGSSSTVEHQIVVLDVVGSNPICQPIAGVAQLVERKTCNFDVTGSIPVTSSASVV